MDHLVTSSCILSTKHLLAQPLISCDCPFPQNAKIFVKALQSMMLKAVLPVWTHPQLLARQSEPCEPYNICTNSGNCSCPSVLLPSCKLGFVSPGGDDKSEKSIEFLKADDGLSYFSLDFLPPYSNTDLIRLSQVMEVEVETSTSSRFPTMRKSHDNSTPEAIKAPTS
ncbi:uncharacterized protein LOC127092912 [Lathyrus oleraceus]|nr:uncharacterized protein LOC127092912 [Pisum sativum]